MHPPTDPKRSIHDTVTSLMQPSATALWFTIILISSMVGIHALLTLLRQPLTAMKTADATHEGHLLDHNDAVSKGISTTLIVRGSSLSPLSVATCTRDRSFLLNPGTVSAVGSMEEGSQERHSSRLKKLDSTGDLSQLTTATTNGIARKRASLSLFRRNHNVKDCLKWKATQKCKERTCKLEEDFHQKHCLGPTKPLECELCFGEGSGHSSTSPNFEKIAQHCCTVEAREQTTLTILGSLFLAMMAVIIVALFWKDCKRKRKQARQERLRQIIIERRMREKSPGPDKALNGQSERPTVQQHWWTKSSSRKKDLSDVESLRSGNESSSQDSQSRRTLGMFGRCRGSSEDHPSHSQHHLGQPRSRVPVLQPATNGLLGHRADRSFSTASIPAKSLRARQSSRSSSAS